MLGLNLLVPVAFVAVSFVGTAYWYYTDSQATIAQLRENAVLLEQANKTNQEAIAQLQEDAALFQKLNAELSNKMAEADSKVDALRNKLIDHDLTQLSLKKPGLIEKRVNNGTKKAFEYLESITAYPTPPSLQSPAEAGEASSN